MIKLPCSGYKSELWQSLPFISAFLIAISSCKQEDHLILRKRTGEEFRTNGNTCPFGSFFYKEPPQIDCVCSRGLWAFYQDSCGSPNFIQGSVNQICTPVDSLIQKSLLVSDTNDPIFTALHPKDGIVLKLFQNSINYPFKLDEGELVLVSGEWKIGFQDGHTFCLGKANNFCLYESHILNYKIIDNVLKGPCDDSSDILTHWQCSSFSDDKQDQGYCQEATTHHRSRRQSIPDGQHGRILLPSVLAMNPKFKENYEATVKPVDPNAKFPPEDEDDEVVNREGNKLIKSEIWNYLTEKANVILRLTDPPSSKDYKMAVFSFLNTAKEIIQKTCPLHYVPSSHFDLSVDIFRILQIREMFYYEPPISHEQFERISNVLSICLQSVPAFNFTELKVPRCNLSQEADNANTVLKDKAYEYDPYAQIGLFRAFDSDQYIDIPQQLSPWNREPIIETVWNIFFHAHSICFPYFNNSVSNSSYNDHHKFATIMMSLFTNGILDVWTEIKELNEDIYSGFLGNAKILMANVVHCAISGRLDRNQTYPWDLQRPNSVASTPDPTRKKRQVETNFLQDNNQAQLGCLNSIEENSFVCRE